MGVDIKHENGPRIFTFEKFPGSSDELTTTSDEETDPETDSSSEDSKTPSKSSIENEDSSSSSNFAEVEMEEVD